eukprot:COSAG06_NODE_49547_length_324_cov_2.035556_1_plen_34_part_10
MQDEGGGAAVSARATLPRSDSRSGRQQFVYKLHL